MPGLNIGNAQAEYLKTLHLDEIGQGKNVVEGVRLSEVEKALLSAAAFFKVSAEDGLNESNAVSSAALGESIQFDKVKYFGGAYSVEISVLDYFKWVNSGVNGLKKKHGSPYSFHNMGVSKNMLKEIRKWVIREGLKVRTKEALHKPIHQEKKGKPFSGLKNDEATKAAFVVSKAVKRNGIKPTHFWDKAVKATAKEMQQGLGTVLLPVIINELKKK